jgi:hypothetical protein
MIHVKDPGHFSHMMDDKIASTLHDDIDDTL